MTIPITLSNSVVNKKLRCKITFNDSWLYWKKAKFRLVYEVKVVDNSPVDGRKVLYKEEFVIDSSEINIDIDLKKYRAYTYRWKLININFFVDLVVDDSLFFDTKITQIIQNQLWVKPKVSTDSKSMINPKDNFNIIDNLKAIPIHAKVFVIALSVIWWIVMIINSIVWIHDQLVSEANTFFYSHYNSDGEISSPFFNALALDWWLWAFIWLMIKTQLKKYMNFFFKIKDLTWSRTKLYNVSDIVWWKSRVDLENVKLKIVACNMEKGQYVRWSWSNRRTVSFSNPVRALSIFEKEISFIPKNEDISYYLKGVFSFEKMYKILYPEQAISKSHWLIVHWEVQLIHDKLIDQELIGKSNIFKYEHFLEW